MRLAEFTLTSFDQMLATFHHLLTRAGGDETLLAAKLADDMAPLATQVRFAGYQVANTLNRLAGAALELPGTDPATLAEASAELARLRTAIAAAGDFVPDDTPTGFDLPNGMAFDLTAAEYVRDWALPQFYFHVMIAYAILRSRGIAVGKADYVPYMARHARKAPA